MTHCKGAMLKGWFIALLPDKEAEVRRPCYVTVGDSHYLFEP